jgi:hypothetical protein
MTMDPPYLRSSHWSMASVLILLGTENRRRRIHGYQRKIGDVRHPLRQEGTGIVVDEPGQPLVAREPDDQVGHQQHHALEAHIGDRFPWQDHAGATPIKRSPQAPGGGSK